MAVIAQDVIKYITERPGAVVYRDDVADALGLEARQVGAVVLRFQKESPMGSEVETVIRGNAWRFVPTSTVDASPATTTVTTTTNGQSPRTDLPLTSLIRQYLIEHPHVVVWVKDLMAYTGRSEYQVKVGVNNMRRATSNQDVVRYVHTALPGQAWRFEPPPNWRPPGTPRPTSSAAASSPVPTASARAAVPRPVTSTPSATAPVASTNGDASDLPTGEARRFEEVGTAGEVVIIKDTYGKLYRAVPLD